MDGERPDRYPLHHKLRDRVSRVLHDWRLSRVHRLLAKLEGDSNYVKHCRRELASWFAEGDDSPNRWIADDARDRELRERGAEIDYYRRVRANEQRRNTNGN